MGSVRLCQVNEKTNGASPYQLCFCIVVIYLLTDTDVSTNYRIVAIKNECLDIGLCSNFLVSVSLRVHFLMPSLTDAGAD